MISPDSAEFDPDQILTFVQWCGLCGFSAATGRRVIASGQGPAVTWLSPKRMGIRRQHNSVWLDKRAESAA
jgi:hypothetical protein